MQGGGGVGTIGILYSCNWNPKDMLVVIQVSFYCGSAQHSQLLDIMASYSWSVETLKNELVLVFHSAMSSPETP